jgi:hypothetical protein
VPAVAVRRVAAASAIFVRLQVRPDFIGQHIIALQVLDPGAHISKVVLDRLDVRVCYTHDFEDVLYRGSLDIDAVPPSAGYRSLVAIRYKATSQLLHLLVEAVDMSLQTFNLASDSL